MDTDSFSNSTSIVNDTDVFDRYCKQFVSSLVVGTLIAPCACVGIPASVWLLWVLIQRQRSGLSNDLYMLNLTIIDLIYNMFKCPSLMNFFFWRDNLLWEILLCLDGLSLNGRPLFMACMCADCYMAVVYPIVYMKLKRSRYRTVVCASVWILTVAFSLLFQESGLQVHQFTVWGILRLLAISIIAFCNLAILRALRKPDPSGRNDVHPQKQRAQQIIINSFLMTLVSYLPPLVVYFLSTIIPLDRQEKWCNVILPSLVPTMLGSTTMPLLYLANLGKLKYLSECGCNRSV
ncbi:lysophosphatidic acid receptor 6-like [Clupea harengus]|uniref:Lysophosphatidic acid receptor 6-like n=1 Tax=Clupea harengus TaxID=7950 RepID=A0A6P8EW93_CLUHA|nr:lysophosphatidic acid receptor 6-like [Clupea harengus]